jgi:hypothetical protein
MDGINDDELNRCYRIIACIVRDKGDKYLPIFQRVHDEIESRKANRKLKDIALQAASQHI